MKDNKVIELIDDYLTEPHNISREWVEALTVCRQALLERETKKQTDYLISNGVVSPPCKIGDTVYIVTNISGKIKSCKVIGVWMCEQNYSIITDIGTICRGSFGETVFITREEAEKKMKEGR